MTDSYWVPIDIAYGGPPSVTLALCPGGQFGLIPSLEKSGAYNHRLNGCPIVCFQTLIRATFKVCNLSCGRSIRQQIHISDYKIPSLEKPDGNKITSQLIRICKKWVVIFRFRFNSWTFQKWKIQTDVATIHAWIWLSCFSCIFFPNGWWCEYEILVKL